jgi:hypothetical protein
MRGQVKLNTAPSKLATLARRLARGLAKIPAPALIYLLEMDGSPVAAYRNRHLAEEACKALPFGRAVLIAVPVRG